MDPRAQEKEVHPSLQVNFIGYLLPLPYDVSSVHIKLTVCAFTACLVGLSAYILVLAPFRYFHRATCHNLCLECCTNEA